MTLSALPDIENNAVLTLSKSLDAGDIYFGYEVPDVPSGYERCKIIKGYNLF